MAISHFWPPNENEGSQMYNPEDATNPHGDYWGAGVGGGGWGAGRCKKLPYLPLLRWTRKRGWPQRAEVPMKGMNSASPEARIFLLHRKLNSLIPYLWSPDCLLPLLQTCIQPDSPPPHPTLPHPHRGLLGAVFSELVRYSLHTRNGPTK